MRLRFLGMIYRGIIALILVSHMSVVAEVSETDLLIDSLVQKGVITPEMASAIRAETAIKKQNEKEAQKEFWVTAGKQIKVAGYTQVRYQFHTNRTNNDTDNVSSFDIRRARVDLKGAITERFNYRLQVEFGGTSVKLLDATAMYTFAPELKITIGQFKVPFSLENLTSSHKLETINRSQVVEALVARGKDVIGNHNGRDIGLQLSGNLLEIKNQELLEYAFGIFNGAGTNTQDVNINKDYVGRLIIHPLPGLDIGGAYYRGYAGKSSVGKRRDRAGAEISYSLTPLTVKGEFIYGKDSVTEKIGWYAQAGIFAVPKILQFVVRYDSYDPDLKISDNITNVVLAGVNLFITKWTFLQTNYEVKYVHPDDIRDHAILTQFTIQF